MTNASFLIGQLFPSSYLRPSVNPPIIIPIQKVWQGVWHCVQYRLEVVVEHRTRLPQGSTTKLVSRALEYSSTSTPYVKDPLPEIQEKQQPFERLLHLHSSGPSVIGRETRTGWVGFLTHFVGVDLPFHFQPTEGNENETWMTMTTHGYTMFFVDHCS